VKKSRSCLIKAFATLVPQICLALNNTANTTTSPIISSSPMPSSTILPFTGEATKLDSGVVGLMGVALLVWML
jgi:hypothetical protein